MSISMLFSILIYQTSMNELITRFDAFSTQLEDTMVNFSPDNYTQFEEFRDFQIKKSQTNLLVALFYTNLAIMLAAGLASYFLARKSLQPIEKSHEAQSRFTSDASHELRTPLAVMKSELEVALRDAKLSKSDMKELLESNLEEVDRLTELSNMLLRLSKSEITNLDMDAVNVQQVVQKALRAMHKNHRVDVHIGTHPIYIKGHMASITELLLILFDNAHRYSPNTSPIHLYAKQRGSSVVIEIINEGNGVTQQDLPYVFDRFYRGEKSRTSQQASGYGLGLSLAKNIVDLHDGIIKISSIEGKSTSVTVTLKKSSGK
jgi:two-component system sensor histidine kinase CiaH